MISILYDKLEEFKICTLPPKVLANPVKYNLGHTETEVRKLKLSYEQGKFYFCKNPESIEFLLNELIGMYYAKLIGLATVEYKMKKRSLKTPSNKNSYKEYVYLLSENFWNSSYMNIKSLIEPNDNVGIDLNDFDYRFKFIDLSKIINVFLIEDIIKLTSIDLVMLQDDRNSGGICFKKENGIIRLGQLLDYEIAYDTDHKIPKKGTLMYSNPFLDIEISEKGLEELMIKFPVTYSIFKSLIDIEFRYILSEIEKNYPLEISDDKKEELTIKDESIRQLMKKLI